MKSKIKKRTAEHDTIEFLRWTLSLVEGRDLSPAVARLLRFPLECALGMVEDMMRKELGRSPANSEEWARA